MNRIFCIILSLLFIASFFGCDDAEKVQRLTRQQKEEARKADSASLKIGVMPTSDCLPIVVAKELRLFDTLGVDVHLRHYHALTECRKALKDSLVEGAVIDSVLFNILKEEKVPLEVGMTTNLTWKFLTAKKARITRLDQLSDKMIAADGHGESYRLAESAIDSLQKKKMHVFIIQVDDPSVRLNMLTTGNVDAALLPEPFASKAVKKGAKYIDKVKSTPKGLLAFRTDATKPKSRKEQIKLFHKAVAIAKDSIAKYKEEHYLHLLR